MKKALIILGISAFLLGLIMYIIYNYSPYDSNKLVEISGMLGISDPNALTDNIDDLISYGLVFTLMDVNVVAVIAVLGLAFSVCFVGGLHMLIEKLFFKKFYEEPRIWPALRRGVLLYLVIFGLIFFRMIGGSTWQNDMLIIILTIVLEITAIKFTDKRN